MDKDDYDDESEKEDEDKDEKNEAGDDGVHCCIMLHEEQRFTNKEHVN